MNIDKEMFDEWLAHPVTEYVLKRVALIGEQSKQKWIEDSWGGGKCDPLVLADLRARAEAAKDLSELKFEDINEE